MKNDQELLDDELENLSPRLRALRRQEDGFRHPADYFDRMEGEVFQQLDALGARRRPAAGTPQPGFWSVLSRLWSPRLALACGTVLVLAVVAWWMLDPEPATTTARNTPLAQEELTPEDAEAYVRENMLDFEPEQLAALAVLDEEVNPTNQPPAPKSGQGSKAAPKSKDELSPEELELLLDDLSDEELEQLL